MIPVLRFSLPLYWPEARWMLGAAGLCVAAALAVSSAVSLDQAYRDSGVALRTRGGNPMALGAQAELQAALGKSAAATPLARRALQANPLNGLAYRAMAWLAQQSGDEGEATALMRRALQRTPGDLTARYWLIDHAVEQGRMAEAMALQDHLLQSQPLEAGTVFAVWQPLMIQPQPRAVMVGLLAANPPWRKAFLEFLMRAGDPVAVDRLFAALDAQGGLQPAEAAIWSTRMAQDGHWLDAFQVWQRHAPRAAQAGWPLNGTFAAPAGTSPFDWVLDTSRGIQATLAPTEDGYALRLVFMGQRSALDLRGPLSLLAAGHYRMRWRARLERFETAQGLLWSVECAAAPRQALGTSALLVGETDWQPGEFAFSVPAGCGAVQLHLRLAARIAAETQAYGTAWFDDLRFDRV